MWISVYSVVDEERIEPQTPTVTRDTLRGSALLLASATASIALGWGVAAYAVNANNMVGNPNYDNACVNGGPNGGGTVCRTDNAGWTFYMDSSGEFELEVEDRQAVNYAMNSQYDPTDLNVSYDNSPTFSGSAETDLIWQEGAIGTGSDGVTWCDDDSPAAKYECDQHYVRIRGAGVYSTRLTCHEAGHGAGLLHGASASPQTSQTDPDLGCMTTPVGTNSLGSNQVNRINAVY